MKKIKFLPEPFQRQILIRMLTGVCVAAVTVIFSAAYRDVSFLPALVIAGALIIWGFRIMDKAQKNEYLIIHGICKQTDISLIKKQIKSILVSTETTPSETILLKINLRRRKNSVWIGCEIDICIDKDAVFYERDGIYIVEKYLFLQNIN